MSIQVTGSFQLQNGTFAENPQLWLNPNLPYKGVLNLQTQVDNSTFRICLSNTSSSTFYSILCCKITSITTTLIWIFFQTSSMENPYDALIDSLNIYVVDILEVEQPNCTYTVLV